MSLRLVDSFDDRALSSSANVTAKTGNNDKWSYSAVGSPTFSSITGRTGNGLQVVAGAAQLAGLRATFGSSIQTWIISFAIKWTSGSTGLMRVQDTGSDQFYIDINSDGTLTLSRGGGTALGTTSGTLNSGSWDTVELKVKISTSVGTYELKLNGVSEFSGSGNTAGAGGTTGNTLDIYAIGNTLGFDDYVVNDDAGTVSDFLDAPSVSCLLPSGAGSTTQWTPNTGANYAAVDDAAYDDDTTYVADATVGNIDTYAVPNLPGGAVTVWGVMFNIRARKDDANTRTVAPVVRHGSTNYAGTDMTMTGTYKTFQQIMETNPGTGVNWTVTGVNNAEFGVKVTT